jgi:hypothetical protein
VGGGDIQIVSKVTTDGGPDNAPAVRVYRYTNARSDLAGRGWLGFETKSVRDEARKITDRTRFDNFTFTTSAPSIEGGPRRYVFLGLPLEQRTLTELPGQNGASSLFNLVDVSSGELFEGDRLGFTSRSLVDME